MGLNQALPKKGFEIHAHEQTLAQCKNWLDAYCPDVNRVSVSSNAQAAKNAKKNSEIFAIAGALAAGKYGLEIIKRNIEDYSNNTTRFISIGLQEVASTGKDKTSLLVTTKNESGALYNLLKPIQKNGLNLTHITYRPSKVDKWNYSFFFDFEGHKDDKKVKSLLEELNSTDAEIKLLGSYPKAEN
jgi:chorismate mutase/prephenate dehydratase